MACDRPRGYGQRLFDGMDWRQNHYQMGLDDHLSVSSTISIFLLQSSIGPLLLFALSAAFGLAFYAIFGLLPAFISKEYDGPATSIVFAFGNIALGLGALTGNYIGGWLKDITGTFYWIYLIVLIAALASMVLCFFLKSRSLS